MSLPHAPLKKRFLAGFIDFLGILVLGTFLDLFTDRWLRSFTELTPTEYLFVSSILFLVTLWILLLFFYLRLGNTPGKKWVGLRVADYPSDAMPSIRQIVIRSLLYPFSYVAYAFGFLMILFHPKRRGLHDLLTGTWVIEDRQTELKQ